MNPNNKVCFDYIKKIQEFFKCFANYPEASQFDEIDTQKTNKSLELLKQIKEYINDLNNLKLQYKIDRNFLERKNYFLYDDSISESEYRKDNNQLALIYTPQSVNFFYKSFRGILNPYFSPEINLTEEQIQMTNIKDDVANSFNENMIYCPSYIQKAFLTCPNFFDKVINNIFNYPHIFMLHNFNQEMKFKCDDEIMIKLKNKLLAINLDDIFNKTNLKHFITAEKIDDKLDLSLINSDSVQTLIYLIKLGKVIGDQISSQLNEKSFYDAIEEFLIDKSDVFQVNFFTNLKECGKSQDGLESNQLILNHYANGLKCSLFYLKNNFIQSQINDVLFNIRTLTFNKTYFKFRKHNYHDYIKNPLLFSEDVSYFKNIDENSRKIRRKQKEDNFLERSGVQAKIQDPLFCHQYLIEGITINKFKKERIGLHMLDQLFASRLLCEEYDDKKTIAKYDKSLYELMINSNNFFNEITSPFVASFNKQDNPYQTARAISKSYNKLIAAVKLLNGLHPDRSEEAEKRFISTLIRLTKPPNIISIYVYLFEFLNSPKYNDIYSYLNLKTNHLKVTRKIFKYCFTSLFEEPLEFEENLIDDEDKINFDINLVEFCKISHTHVNIKVKNDKDEFNKIAHLITDDENLAKSYYESFVELTTEGNPQQFTFKIFLESQGEWLKNTNEDNSDNLDDIECFVCHATLDEKYDVLPVDKKELYGFLSDKALKESK